MEYSTYKKKKEGWIGDIVQRNCFLEHLIERRIE
jgi:hypothetical protein